MKAAVVETLGEPPVLADFPAPQPRPGTPVGRLVAAALNPVDVVIAAGSMPHRMGDVPFVAGYDAVVQLDSGEHVYVAGPPLPFGTLAEQVPTPEDRAIPVPAGVDPVVAAALGVPGLAAWLSLEYRGGLRSGENVLILGSGQVGLLAVQVAQVMGAARVVVADIRPESLDAAAALGADGTVNLAGADGEAIRAAFARQLPGGVDLVLDLVWGDVVNQAIDVSNMDARLVQVGNAGAPTAALAAAVFRNKHMSIIGQSIFVAPPDVRRAAYRKLANAAARGAIIVPVETAPLADIRRSWNRLRSGSLTSKLVVVP